MTAELIWLISTIGYILGTMVTARVLHIKHSKAWMRWKNACPSKITKIHQESSYSVEKPRREVELYEFIKNGERLIGKELTPRGCAFFWPFFAPVWAINKFCFPEVKIGDAARINDLEIKELKDL